MVLSPVRLLKWEKKTWAGPSKILAGIEKRIRTAQTTEYRNELGDVRSPSLLPKEPLRCWDFQRGERKRTGESKWKNQSGWKTIPKEVILSKRVSFIARKEPNLLMHTYIFTTPFLQYVPLHRTGTSHSVHRVRMYFSMKVLQLFLLRL
jgi:hypothetical protein